MYGLYAVIHGKGPALIGLGNRDELETRAMAMTGPNKKRVREMAFVDIRALVIRELNTDELVFSVIL